MSQFKLNVQEPWFSLIFCGKKTVEGRLAKNKFTEMKVGDTIIFTNDSFSFERKCVKKIKRINKYKSFREYLNNETIEKCLPTIKKIEQGVLIYRQFYSKNKEIKYGIIAIQFS